MDIEVVAQQRWHGEPFAQIGLSAGVTLLRRQPRDSRGGIEVVFIPREKKFPLAEYRVEQERGVNVFRCLKGEKDAVVVPLDPASFTIISCEKRRQYMKLQQSTKGRLSVGVFEMSVPLSPGRKRRMEEVSA